MARKAQRPDGEPTVPEAAKPAYDAIVGLTDRFCQAHLTHEYQMLCRKLTATLARKRPSPLTRGKPEVWACAVLRVIGWVNFLDDSSQKLHMKLTAIDKAFGVAESTGQGKAKAIRDLLKIRQFDFHWMLRRRVKQAPWYDVRADDKRRARLNCIAHILSMVPYEDATPPPLNLPPRRPPDESYVRPPMSDLNIVPDVEL